MSGYLAQGYAASLAEFGTPRFLPKSRGWILEREIRGTPYRDGMGCYPLFACEDWSVLGEDLEDLGDRLVTLSLVADPFGAYDVALLEQNFDDVRRFKEHFVVDLATPADRFVCDHHRRSVRRACRDVVVEECDEPIKYLDEWVELYAHLVARHGITGLRAFSRSAFEQQLRVPGLTLLRATSNGITVGATLWYVTGEVAYYHLGAYNDEGYRHRASFALFWHAIHSFAAKRLRWLNLGAGAGVDTDGADGLTRFKRGWATGTRVAHFCGRIFDHERYREIVEARDSPATTYFPAYRIGEFT
jgi:hypothetical protein